MGLSSVCLCCAFCLSPGSHTQVTTRASEVVFLFPFCPYKAIISMQPKGCFLDHKLNITLLLKICRHIRALGLISTFLTIVYQELSPSCFSFTFKLVCFLTPENIRCIFQISCFTQRFQFAVPPFALGLRAASLRAPLTAHSNVTLPCISWMTLTIYDSLVRPALQCRKLCEGRTTSAVLTALPILPGTCGKAIWWMNKEHRQPSSDKIYGNCGRYIQG